MIVAKQQNSSKLRNSLHKNDCFLYQKKNLDQHTQYKQEVKLLVVCFLIFCPIKQAALCRKIIENKGRWKQRLQIL